MTYRIIISKSVQKQIDALSNEMCDRVVEKLQQLMEEPRPSGVVKLKGTDNEYRIRVGDYRIRYEVNDQDRAVRLLQCKHRREVYRDEITSKNRLDRTGTTVLRSNCELGDRVEYFVSLH